VPIGVSGANLSRFAPRKASRAVRDANHSALMGLLVAIVALFPLVTPPQLLLAETDHKPHASIRWTTREGKHIVLESDFGYTNPSDRIELGRNIAAYVALGGTRLDTGCGHPRGAILRVGFYKINKGKWFFDDIAAGTDVTIELSGVVFNQPVTPRADRVLAHFQYIASDVAACGLGGEYNNLYATAAPDDTLTGKVEDGRNARLGELADRVEVGVDEHGAVRLRAALPYSGFRHIKDPWKLTTPGTFFEPNHFHVEVEVLPDKVAEEMERTNREESAPPAEAPDEGPAGEPPAQHDEDG